MILWTIPPIYQYQIFKEYKKGMVRCNFKNKYYINAQQQIPVPYGSMLHIPPTNLLLLAAKQELYKKAYLLTKNIEEFYGKFKRMGQYAEKDKTERTVRVGRRTREETVKWNQMTALRFQTGGRHQTTLTSFWGTWLKVLVSHKAYTAISWPTQDLNRDLW